MSSLPIAALQSWSIPTWTSLALGLALVLYVRGWRQLKRSRPDSFPLSRPAAFASGLAVFWLAIASPLDAFTGLLLSAHMVQHLLLMSVAPPLMLMAAPVVPLLRGLPASISRDVLGPFIAWPAAQRLGRAWLHPAFCWIVMSLTLLAWHVPAAYELALRSASWHRVEHASFLAASLLFWWPVVAPWPAVPRWPRLAMPLYLLAANVVMSALGAWLTFAEHPIYATYAMAPRVVGLSPLDDQRLAGLLMWIPGSVAYLVPAVAIAIAALSPKPRFATGGVQLQAPWESGVGSLVRGSGVDTISSQALKADPTSRRPRPWPAFDLLRAPMIGRILRAQLFRRVLQSAALVVVIAVIVDGLFGHPMGGMNLAGVVPWIFGRGLFVLALLAAGNLFCFACPFTLPRALGRRLGRATKRWPHWLHAKWVAVGLLVLFFGTADVFEVWDTPRWTAVIVVAYFATAFVVDSRFRGAAFCKYVCPVGQFSFVASLVSPFEVKVRQPETCATCTTADCLCGNTQTHGCEMDLFLPQKAGSVDCTFCLDCVRACPHDNIGVIAVIPAATLVRDVRRSSVGRFSRRLDVAALALVVVLAAFTSAAVMVLPRSPLTVLDRRVARVRRGRIAPLEVEGLG